MNNIIKKTFGGLSKPYYLRQLFFGVIFAILFFGFMPNKTDIVFIISLFVNTFLYPYSRFVYESIVGFLVGDNVFFVNALFLVSAKVMTMSLCFAFAWVIAPVGLLYLYYHHTKNKTFE